MIKFLKVLAVFVAVVFLSVSCGDSKNSGNNRGEYEGDGSEEFVTVGSSSGSDSNKGEGYTSDVDADAGAAPAEDPENEGGNAEREIVESDIYKFDGNVLWLANQHKGLIAVDISDKENLKILGNLKFKGYVGEMYLQEGRAYILVSYTNSSYENVDIYYSGKTYSKLMVVKTEDPANLSLIGEFEIEGWISDSRQVGDVIYVASTEYEYYWYDCDGGDGKLGANQISIMSVNVKDPQNIKMVDKVSVPGYGYTLYVSQKSIYVAEADTYYWTEDYDKGYPVTMFDIGDPEGKIVKKGEFKTDGFMSDRWKMHEKGDIFYAVSSSSSWGNGDSFIESFDVSDPKNIKKLDKLIFMSNQQLYGTKFEGDRAYAVTYFQQDPLHVIDISDPTNLKQLGELEVPGWSDFIEVRGTTILAVGRDDSKTKISMYDVSNPEDPQEIKTVELGSGYSYSEANDDWKAFKIFDELGLILLPIVDHSDSWETLYKLYLVDFDLEKGLKTRGYIASESYIKRGVAIQDLVFSIGENHVVLADAENRDNPKVLSELTLASYVGNTSRCGEHLCGMDNYYNFNIYDKTNGEILWSTKTMPKNSYSDVSMAKNNNFAYIYPVYIHTEDDVESGIKVIKFNKNGKFEEIGDFEIDSDDISRIQAVSENNVIATLAGVERYGNYFEDDMEIKFIDMNNPKKRIEVADFDFDYESLIREKNIFAVKNTFWTSGCRLKKANKNGDHYFCYALPFDASDPKHPKAGKRVNIPGELVGISKNAKYFYTKTPQIYSYDEKNCEGRENYCWSSENSFDINILKLNEEKTAVKIVAKETLINSYAYDYDSYKSVENTIYPKDDKLFFVKTSTGEEWDTCSYKTGSVIEIRIVSAENGTEVYKKLFKNANFAMNVNEGGVILSTAEGWTYIAPDGREKSGDYDISSVRSYSYNNGRGGYNAEPQLINGTIYIAAGWDGIVFINVK